MWVTVIIVDIWGPFVIETKNKRKKQRYIQTVKRSSLDTHTTQSTSQPLSPPSRNLAAVVRHHAIHQHHSTTEETTGDDTEPWVGVDAVNGGCIGTHGGARWSDWGVEEVAGGDGSSRRLCPRGLRRAPAAGGLRAPAGEAPRDSGVVDGAHAREDRPPTWCVGWMEERVAGSLEND